MKNNSKPQTRKGAASFYVVIFAALVFTVITVSFIRLMISESSQNTSSDLSQSAYDSALAGIEDAKAAIERCLKNPGTTGCDNLYNDDCNSVTNVLYGDKYSGNNISESADQAYTCVKLTKDVEDYRIRIAGDEPTKVVKINNGTKVEISWYSASNKDSDSGSYSRSFGKTNFPIASKAPIPPVISVGVIQEGEGKDHINTVVIRPSSDTSSGKNVQEAYEIAKNTTNSNNYAAQLKCGEIDEGEDFDCSTTIDAKSEISYLILNLPYNEATAVDFKVRQFRGNEAKVFDSQIAVDSTGRANDYYRRVEARLQLSDVHFPYPDYVVSADDGGNSSGISKNFYVTKHCWNVTSGTVKPCDDVADL